MKIHITTIPAEGLKLDQALPLEELNKRMHEGRSNDTLFTEAPQISIVLHRRVSSYECTGTVKTCFRQPCARCLKELDQGLSIDAHCIIKQKPPQVGEDPQAALDDLGIFYFEGDIIDLEQIFQEKLILALRPFLQPEVDPQGRCKTCGEDLSSLCVYADKPKDTLGSLLKKAGVR